MNDDAGEFSATATIRVPPCSPGFDALFFAAMRATSRIAAPATASLALLGLVGWAAGAPILRSFVPGRPNMSPFSAVCLLIAALALGLLAPREAPRPRRVAGRACATLVLVASVVTLADMAGLVGLDGDLVLPTLLPSLRSPADDTLPPLAGPTAVCLALQSAALLLLDRRRGARLGAAEALALAAGLVAHAVLTGHAYDAEWLYQQVAAPATDTSLPTALALALLTAGILLARPEAKVMATIASPRVGGTMARRLLIPALFGPPLLGFVVLALPAHATQGMSLSHALLATASSAVAVALTVVTAASLNRVDELQRRTEDEVRRWQEIASSVEDAIVAQTPEGTVTSWNPAAERLFGWRREEIVGRPGATLVPADRREELAGLDVRLARGEAVAAIETRRLRRDGEAVEVALSLTNIVDRAGRIVGIATVARDIGARKAAERRYADLFEHASDGVFIADRSGAVTEVNAAACRLLGRTCEEIVGRRVGEFVAPEEAERLAGIREALERGEVAIADFTLLGRDGAPIPVEMSAKLRDSTLQVFAHDLRARKQAEVALARAHQAERGLRLRMEALAAASAAISDAVASIATTDLAALLLVVARQAQALTNARYVALGLGTDPSRPFDEWVYLGMSAEQAAQIGRKPRPVGLLGAVMREGHAIRLRDVAEFSGRVGFPPNHPPMRSFLGVPLMFAGRSRGHLYLGEKQGAAEFSVEDERALEILAERAATAVETAQLYRDEALARSWLRGVLDGLPEAVILVDARGSLSYNRAAARFRSEPEAVGRPCFDLRDAAGAGVELPLTRALRGELVTGEELFTHQSDGRRVPVLASASPLRDDSGAIAGAVCVLRDITTLKEIERLREQWTAVVAHDLRQPLAVISMSARTLRDALPAAPDERVEKALARIRGASERLGRMIRDLLDAAQIEACKLTVERAPVDLRALLAEATARMQSASRREIRLEVADDLPRVLVDADRVEQVMENLLSNATKYGAPDTPVIVRAHARAGEAVVSTTNFGPDLPAAERARLFTRFYRARTAGAAAGVGLGLYIAHGLIEAHGGQIWVESAGGETTFSFTLPLA